MLRETFREVFKGLFHMELWNTRGQETPQNVLPHAMKVCFCHADINVERNVTNFLQVIREVGMFVRFEVTMWGACVDKAFPLNNQLEGAVSKIKKRE
jgi:hypothetical protein